MSLNLDARQRAMLQEMGVHVWSPKPAPVVTAGAAVTVAPSTAPASAVRPPQPTAPAARHAAAHAAPPAAASVATASGAQLHWVLQAPQPLYPDAPAASTTPTDTTPRWLLVAEGVAGVPPLAGDAGTLLDNMLHALGLRQQPHVFICLLTPVASEAAPGSSTASTYRQVLTAAAADVQPAVVLLMGRAARAVLGRTEPLGQLRLLAHSVANRPAVVTYDAPYLLRAPAAKAAAWDDLCRAKALALQFAA